MLPVIVRRDTLDAGQQTYLTFADVRGLGIETCGCEESVCGVKRLVKRIGGIITVEFNHGDSRCFGAFTNGKDDFAPMNYDAYKVAMGLDEDD
jgi:hypothetical protein